MNRRQFANTVAQAYMDQYHPQAWRRRPVMNNPAIDYDITRELFGACSTLTPTDDHEARVLELEDGMFGDGRPTQRGIIDCIMGPDWNEAWRDITRQIAEAFPPPPRPAGGRTDPQRGNAIETTTRRSPHFYAASHVLDVRFAYPDGWTVFVFDSAAARAAFVTTANRDRQRRGLNPNTEAVDRDTARKVAGRNVVATPIPDYAGYRLDPNPRPQRVDYWA